MPAGTVKNELPVYSGNHKVLERSKGLIRESAKILIVDEWIESGAQMQAVIKLIVKKMMVAGTAAINIGFNPKPRLLQERYQCHAI